MLDPELIAQLAAQPERNAPDVNIALAEEGHLPVLMTLAASPATPGEALRTIFGRIDEVVRAPSDDDDGPSPAELTLEFDRRLLQHPSAPADVRDAILERHADEAFFVLAAAARETATERALERLAGWSAACALFDRIWVELVPRQALPPLLAETWAQSDDVDKRELVARLTDDGAILDALAIDPSRFVRRGVATNAASGDRRKRLAAEDPACEVRARAAAARPERRHGDVSVASAQFAAAERAMENGGILSPDVADAIRTAGPALDTEGALLAAQVLAPQEVVSLIEITGGEALPADVGLASGLGLRAPGDDETPLRELVVGATKVLPVASARYGGLTGKARLAAWVADGLAGLDDWPADALLRQLCAHPIAAERAVLGRAIAARPALLGELCEAAKRARAVPASLMELAWLAPDQPDDAMVAMAKKVGKRRRRGRDLVEDEVDLDPSARSLKVLEKVAFALSRKVVLSPRTVLAVVAMDSRRVRYVLTAMPSWKGPLCGAHLARVLRQNAGALTAGRAESRHRGSANKGWTQRVMTDAEMAIAFAIGHIEPAEALARIERKRHRLIEGNSLAAAADARACLAGSETIKALLRWSLKNRFEVSGAFSLWVLLERHDRDRPDAMIGSAVDRLVSSVTKMPPDVIDTLAALEQRRPGRLERIPAQSPRGKAAMASAIARAYRATGGLRDEH